MRPAELVRRDLAAARERGETFDEAWPRAIRAIPARTYERAEWISALEWARPAFEHAYHRAEAGQGAVIEDLLLAA